MVRHYNGLDSVFRELEHTVEIGLLKNTFIALTVDFTLASKEAWSWLHLIPYDKVLALISFHMEAQQGWRRDFDCSYIR